MSMTERLGGPLLLSRVAQWPPCSPPQRSQRPSLVILYQFFSKPDGLICLAAKFSMGDMGTRPPAGGQQGGAPSAPGGAGLRPWETSPWASGA